MRTTVDLDSDLLAEAVRRSGGSSRKAVLESALRLLIDWLDYNRFTVVTKPAKEFNDGEGRRKLKRNISVELAIDAMELADYLDQIVLFAGDGDFRSLIEALQGRGVRVTVVSTIESRPPVAADELRRQADVRPHGIEAEDQS